ncbi:unnamed protein product [Nippostrongylus brasiliensis]|uniref:LIMR family protein (inferred by orthology to a C. elegans protein) n=1 Tax=Nippostrongylus brasiliensis TaxID=27835 RepID=A0A0N4YHF7_NIPBR|nr:unnamed protein product [Nippostrongylus brasiliensis]
MEVDNSIIDSLLLSMSFHEEVLDPPVTSINSTSVFLDGTESIVNSLRAVLSASGWALWRALVGPTAEEEEAARLEAIRRQEREFHEYVRQQIICLLIFISLYLLSYWIISLFKSKSDNDSLYAGDEDYFVYRISVWMCTASLAISIGSIALLPFSVVSSELLQRYPDNYYLQWMSWSLINNLWNYVFALSNLSLFVLLPFSYFFIESQGFSKNKNGIMQRVYETLAVCALLIVVILCLADVVLTLMSSSVSLISISSVNLPLIYSFVSFAGVMLLLLSTPIGFGKIFGLVGEMTMVGTRILKAIFQVSAHFNCVGFQNSISIPDQDDVAVARLEKYSKARRSSAYGKNNNIRSSGFEAISPFYSPASHGYSPLRMRSFRMTPAATSIGTNDSVKSVDVSPVSYGRGLGPHMVTSQIWTPLHQKSRRWCQQFIRIVKYPVMVLSLLTLTGIALLMVVINSLKLLFGFRSLPVYAQYMEVHTRHSLGIVGVIVESIIIM